MAFKDRLDLITAGFSSLRELAREIGISESAIRKWQKGETEPTLGNLVTLSRLGGVNVEWLATGQGPMRKEERSGVESPTLAQRIERLEKSASSKEGAPIDFDNPELTEALHRLAERYGVGAATLARLIDDLGAVGVGDDFVLVPRLDVTASAGPGALNHRERVLDRMAFRLDWIKAELRLPLAGLMVVRARGDSMVPTIGEGDVLLIDGGQERLSDGGIYVIMRGEELIVKRVQSKADGFILVSDNPRYQPEPVLQSEHQGPRVIGRVVWIGHRL